MKKYIVPVTKVISVTFQSIIALSGGFGGSANGGEADSNSFRGYGNWFDNEDD